MAEKLPIEAQNGTDLESIVECFPVEAVYLPHRLEYQQSDLYAALERLATEKEAFHDWYLGALEALDSPGRDKFPQAAHSLRELCDRLPAKIAEMPEFKSPLPEVRNLERDFLRLKTEKYPEGGQQKHRWWA